jgi:hypothetical protein
MGTDLATPRDRLGMDERRGPDPLVASGGADSFQLRSELLGIAFVDYAPVPPRMQYAISSHQLKLAGQSRATAIRVEGALQNQMALSLWKYLCS